VLALIARIRETGESAVNTINVTSIVETALKGRADLGEVMRSERAALTVCDCKGEPLAEIVVLRVGEYESRGVQSMYAHTAATLETLAKALKERAGVAWSNDDTDTATILKHLSAELLEKARENRKAQSDEEKRFECFVA
jgi:hypothetical protein